MVEASLSAKVTSAMEQFEIPLLKYVTGILKDPEQARDIVQEAFIRYVKHLNSQKPAIDNLSAWLYRVSHNLSLDFIRKNKRKADGFDEIKSVVRDESVQSPDKELQNKDDIELVWKGVETLSDREKEIVHVKIKKQLSYKEIAERMDLTTSNVGFILHKTMKKLAVYFQQNNSIGTRNEL